MRHKALFRWNLICVASILCFLLYHRKFEEQADAAAVIAELASAGSPCIGLFSRGGVMISSRSYCPEGYAIVGNRNYSVPAFTGNCTGDSSDTPEEECRARSVQVEPVCCPLPPDALDTSTIPKMTASRCGDGYVATGGVPPGSCTDDCDMQCTKINSERYMLGAPRSSIFWTKRSSVVRFGGGLTGRGESKMLAWESIPLGVRFALGRVSYDIWDNDGCIGDPIGSLLVEKRGVSCDGYIYRQLLRKDGSPVPIISRCSSVRGLYSDAPECVP